MVDCDPQVVLARIEERVSGLTSILDGIGGRIDAMAQPLQDSQIRLAQVEVTAKNAKDTADIAIKKFDGLNRHMTQLVFSFIGLVIVAVITLILELIRGRL